jgi:adenylate kinase
MSRETLHYPDDMDTIDTISMVGLPGAGKGTVTEYMEAQLKDRELVNYIVGNRVRANLHEGTAIGMKMREYTNKGRLVPDELIMPMIQNDLREVRREALLIVDGCPRKQTQIEPFERTMDMLQRSPVIVNMHLSNDPKIAREIIHQRVAHRREQAIKKGLEPRKDDHPDVVDSRLEEAKPLADVVAHFEAKGQVINIDASKEPEGVEAEAQIKILSRLRKTLSIRQSA